MTDQSVFSAGLKLRARPLKLPSLGGEAEPFAKLVLAIGAVYVVLFLAFAPLTRVTRPYSDLFDLIDVYFGAERTRDWLHYLFQPHSYHRLPFFRLLLALDIDVFKGTGIPFIAAATACLSVIGALLVRCAMNAPVKALRVPGATFVLMLVLTTGNTVHLMVAANTPYVHMVFFSLLALLLAEPGDGESRAPLSWRRVGALACACGAAFSLATGFVLWPVMAFMAWRRGEADRRWLITLLAVGGAFATLYVNGLTPEKSAGSLTVGSLVLAVEYFFAFLGLPWVRANLALGQMVGMAMFALSAYALLTKGGPRASRYERVAVSLVLFSLGVAALAAIGRQGVAEGGVVVVPGRYNLFLTPMKAGLVLLALPWLERRWQVRPRQVQAAVLAVLVAYCAQQVMIGRTVAASAEHLRATITAFQEGQRTDEMKVLIYPDLTRAAALSAEIAARGLYRSH